MDGLVCLIFHFHFFLWTLLHSLLILVTQSRSYSPRFTNLNLNNHGPPRLFLLLFHPHLLFAPFTSTERIEQKKPKTRRAKIMDARASWMESADSDAGLVERFWGCQVGFRFFFGGGVFPLVLSRALDFRVFCAFWGFSVLTNCRAKQIFKRHGHSSWRALITSCRTSPFLIIMHRCVFSD